MVGADALNLSRSLHEAGLFNVVIEFSRLSGTIEAESESLLNVGRDRSRTEASTTDDAQVDSRPRP